MLWFTLLILLVAAIVAFALGDAGTLGGLDGGMIAAIASSAVLLILFGSSLGGAYSGRWSKAIRDIAIWVGLILVLIAGYAYRDEFKEVALRMQGELLPPGETTTFQDSQTGDRSVRIRRRPDGHFIASTDVNGQRVTMLVDTGATSIVLKVSDAQAAGIAVDRLSYSIPVQTANGTGFAASVRLRSIAVGKIVLEDVDALVANPGVLRESLLGMTFLTRLKSYEFRGDYLTLRG